MYALLQHMPFSVTSLRLVEALGPSLSIALTSHFLVPYLGHIYKDNSIELVMLQAVKCFPNLITIHYSYFYSTATFQIKAVVHKQLYHMSSMLVAAHVFWFVSRSSKGGNISKHHLIHAIKTEVFCWATRLLLEVLYQIKMSQNLLHFATAIP